MDLFKNTNVHHKPYDYRAHNVVRFFKLKFLRLVYSYMSVIYTTENESDVESYLRAKEGNRKLQIMHQSMRIMNTHKRKSQSYLNEDNWRKDRQNTNIL